MKKKLLFFILSLSTLTVLQSQVLFLENFDQEGGPTAGGAGTYIFTNGIPSPFLLRNVDNLTPNASVAYVNDAWERREDFIFNVSDSAAFSTSWYTPAGTANDWMWTPLIGPLPSNTVLSWNGLAPDASYQDGYEVRIMTQSSTPGGPTGGTGVIGNQITNSTLLFSTGGENSTWTPRSVNLNAYTGQSVWIGFRNNSVDKFLLLIDDIKLEVSVNYDAQVVTLDTLTEYTIIPKSQVSPLPLGATIRNNGGLSVTNAVLNVRVFDSGLNLVHTSSSSPVTLTSGQTTQVNAGTWTPSSTPDNYTVQYYTTIAESDQNFNNDTLYWSTVIIDDSTYARDNGVITGGLGIGAGNGGYLGQDFEILNPARLTSIGVSYNRGYTGERFGLAVWDMSGGIPGAIVAVTDTLVYPDDSARYYVLPIHGGNYSLTPGRYVVTAIEFDSTVQVSQTNDFFTTGRTWVNWPTNPLGNWANNEDFGSGFAKSYVIRPYISFNCPADIITGTISTNSSCGGSDGTATVNTTGPGPFTYLWNSGGTTATEINLSAGTYTVTVTDVNSGCLETSTVIVNDNNAPSASISSSTDESCNGCNDGTATVSASGGTPPYTYSWSPSGGNNATATGLGAGTYTVTVTDGGGCSTTTTVTIGTSTTSINENDDKNPLNIYPNPNDGSFTLDVQLSYSGNALIEIIDINGRVVFMTQNQINGTFTGNKITIEGIASGTYALRFTAGDNRFMRKLIIK